MRRPQYRNYSIKAMMLSLVFLLLVSFTSVNSHVWPLRVVRAATTFTVNSTGDLPDNNIGDGICNNGAGACTLRAAIQEANSVAGDDTIAFNVPAASTITLSTALPDLTTNINIVGPGSAQLTVRRSSAVATPDFRIFFNNNQTVNISGMTISNGRTAAGQPGAGFGGIGGSGGGILNAGTMSLTDMVITGNRTGDGGTGGSSTGGFGGFGGGISSAGVLTMTNVTVTNNATGNGAVGLFGGSGGRGAGIYFSGTTLQMTNCTVSGNTGGNGATATGGGSSGNGGDGGGIEAESGNLTLTNVVIDGNHAGDGSPLIASTGGHGGGIVTFPAVTTTMTNCTVSNNNSGQGGGGFSPQGGLGGGIFNNGPLTMIGCTLNGNFTKGPSSGGGASGGAIYNANTLNMVNCTISGNHTDLDAGRGGGIYSGNVTMNLTNCTITGNVSTNNSFEPGRGIHNGGTANIKNTIIAGNGTGGPDVSGNYNSQGNNLVGAVDVNSNGFVNGANGDKVGTTAAPLNALLGSLADNGGPTKTHALLAGSPASDAGNNAFVTNPPFSGPPFTDQRGPGFNRIVDGPDGDITATVDIGAFEGQQVFPNLSAVTGNEDSTITVGFEVLDSGSITSITASSSNTVLVPNVPANITVTGSGANRAITIHPVANLSGTANITVTVNRTGGTEMQTFALTVNPVNDAPSFTKGTDQTVNENSGGQTVNNWATGISAGPADESGQTLTFQILGNTNATLFSAGPSISPTGTLSFTPAAGQSGTATITFALKDNGGTSNGGVDTTASQTFVINVLDGGAMQFNLSSFGIGEAGNSALITVVRIGGTAGEARIDYATSNGTATAGQDYTATSGTLIFPAGSTSQTFSVPIINDTLDEPNETVNLTLSNPAGTGAAGPQSAATLTIFDDEGPPSIAINDVTVTEGTAGTTTAAFTVSLSAASTFTISVNFATTDGTASAASDYQAANGQLTFNPGDLTKTINVQVNGDNSPEQHELFFVNLSNPTNAFLFDSQGIGTILSDDAPGGSISFSSSTYATTEGAGQRLITVQRTGDTSIPVRVNYVTSDGNASLVPCTTTNGAASSRCDFTSAFGTLQIPAGQTSASFPVLITQDSYVEGPETLSIILSNPTGGSVLTGSVSTLTAVLTINDDAETPPNPNDNPNDFVRQHYHDFLNRDPDPGGLAFWAGEITVCGSDQQCLEVKRINVSAAFFLSTEFQETGYLVERIYKVSYGNALGTSTLGGNHQFPVPIIRLNEFLADAPEIARGVIVGQPGWETVLENNKRNFVDSFVERIRFKAPNAFPTTLTASEFVDKMNTNAGGVLLPDERIQLINDLSTGAKTRADVLRVIAEDPDLVISERNRAFVLMQYFGYLRRNPNDNPDLDHTGYEFWLNKLTQFGGNFVNAEMVKAFITSTEYRHRFGN
jgi:CSLREA domain-containing protein